jgi:hypothetical protein
VNVCRLSARAVRLLRDGRKVVDSHELVAGKKPVPSRIRMCSHIFGGERGREIATVYDRGALKTGLLRVFVLYEGFIRKILETFADSLCVFLRSPYRPK